MGLEVWNISPISNLPGGRGLRTELITCAYQFNQLCVPANRAEELQVTEQVEGPWQGRTEMVWKP